MPYEGTSYYRLLQVDFDGQSDFSPVVPVRIGDGVSGLQIYPNPIRDQAWLLIPSDKANDTVLNIFDPAGKLVFSNAIQLQKGSNGINIDLSTLPSGIYFLKHEAEVIRLMKY